AFELGISWVGRFSLRLRILPVTTGCIPKPSSLAPAPAPTRRGLRGPPGVRGLGALEVDASLVLLCFPPIARRRRGALSRVLWRRASGLLCGRAWLGGLARRRDRTSF